MMSIESLMQAVLQASPQKRRELEAVLLGTVQKQQSAKSETRLITISGAARMLALGRNTVYRLIKTKRLDTVDLNGCRRITVKSINEFLGGERPANAGTEKIIQESVARHAASKIRKVA